MLKGLNTIIKIHTAGNSTERMIWFLQQFARTKTGEDRDVRDI